ncbi:MAG: ABC transporter permease [Caldilineaceae bacterium]
MSDSAVLARNLSDAQLPPLNRRSAWRRLLRNWSGLIGLVLVTLYLLLGILASLLAPFDPTEQHPADRLQPPTAQYLFGTDEFGRDVLSRVIHGATNSLRVVLVSVALSTLAGGAIGILAAYAGGWTDQIIMRVVDLFFAFPAILLALAIAAALGPGFRNTILAIAVVYMPIFARVSRAAALDIKALEYMEAAASIGLPHRRLILRHLLPNALPPLLVQITLALSWAMLTEASLSFLGLGVAPPAPAWGSMLSDSRTLMEIAPWMAFAPGFAIMFGVLGFNLLGDGVRDVLDPRENI